VRQCGTFWRHWDGLKELLHHRLLENYVSSRTALRMGPRLELLWVVWLDFRSPSQVSHLRR
jgi:hypothetical protein